MFKHVYDGLYIHPIEEIKKSVTRGHFVIHIFFTRLLQNSNSLIKTDCQIIFRVLTIVLLV